MCARDSKLPKICVMSGPVDIGSMICDELCNLGFDAWTDKDGAYSQADVVQASFFVSLVPFWAINLPKRDEKLVFTRRT